MRGIKSIATALALTISAATLVGTAEAKHKGHWKKHGYHRDRDRDDGDRAAAAIFGFGVGAILGGALSSPRYYAPSYHYQPAPRVYYEPAPAVGGYGLVPWSPEWYAYCDDRYRSFNPRTGYFLGYDGEYHFCR